MDFLFKIRNFNISVLFIVILFSVSIGVMVANNPKLALIGIISIIVLFFVLTKWEVVLGIGLVGLFVIPFGQYEFFNLKIPVIKIDVFTALFFVISFVVVIKSLVSRQNSSIKLGVSFYILLGMIIVYTLIGFSNKASFLLPELKIYVLYMIYFLSICLFNKIQDGFKFLLKIIISSSFLLSCLVMFMYVFKNTIFYPLYEDTFYAEGSRVAVSNLTMFIIIIPILIIVLIFKPLNKFWYLLAILTIPLMGIAVLAEGSRSLIAGVAFNVIITLMLLPFISGKRYARKSVIVLLTFIMIGIIILIIASFGSFGDKLFASLDRFNELFQTGTANSFETRQVTNDYTWELIKKNLWGHGVGTGMWLFSFSGLSVQEGIFIDNGFLTLLFKFGIPGFLIFIAFYVANTLNVLKCYKNNKNTVQGKAAFVILLCLPMFVFATMYMSAQLVTNGVIFGFICLIFAFFNVYRQEQNKSNL